MKPYNTCQNSTSYYLDVRPKWHDRVPSWVASPKLVLEAVGPEWALELLEEVRDVVGGRSESLDDPNRVVKANWRYLVGIWPQ